MLLECGFTLGSDARIVDLEDDRSNILYLYLSIIFD